MLYIVEIHHSGREPSICYGFFNAALVLEPSDLSQKVQKGINWHFSNRPGMAYARNQRIGAMTVWQYAFQVS